MQLFEATTENNRRVMKPLTKESLRAGCGEFFFKNKEGLFVPLIQIIKTECMWIEAAITLGVIEQKDYLSDGEIQKISDAMRFLATGYRDTLFLSMMKSEEYSVALQLIRRDLLSIQRLLGWFLLKEKIALNASDIALNKSEGAVTFSIAFSHDRPPSMGSSCMFSANSISFKNSNELRLFKVSKTHLNDGVKSTFSELSPLEKKAISPMDECRDLFSMYDGMLLPVASPFSKSKLVNHVLSGLQQNGLLNEFNF